MAHTVPERRKYPRLDNNVPVKISNEEFDVVTETRNISCAGAYCQVDKYLEPMTRLKIHLLIPLRKRDKIVTKKISCQGVVVRIESQPARDSFSVAVYFSDIKEKDRRLLADYIDSALSKTTGPSLATK